MIAFILLQLRGLTVWKGNTISHRWTIILQFTCLLFWLLNLIPIKRKKSSQASKLLVPDWNLPENIHILKSPVPSSSMVFQRWSDISSIKYSCWAWWEAMTPLGLFSGCWMLKTGNPLPAMLWAPRNYGEPSLQDCGPQQRLFKGLFRSPQQHPEKHLIVYWWTGGNKEKNTSIPLSSNFWWG